MSGVAVAIGLLAQQEPAPAVELVTNQLILLATVVGAVAALPALIDFIIDARKRRERIALSLDDEPVHSLTVRLAGMEKVLEDIADLVDRAKHPEAYRSLELGNEMLIIGPSLTGKKTLARRIAQLAGMDRLITVYNPRNGDALAKAKTLLRRQTDEKVVLLLPNIDQIFDDTPRDEDEEVESELDALIETTSQRDNVLVIGTASSFVPNSKVDNLFGMKVLLPGVPSMETAPPHVAPAMREVLRQVALSYLDQAAKNGCALAGMSTDQAVERLLREVSNPAEVEDIIQAARTTATFQSRRSNGAPLQLTPEVLEKGIRRVMGHPLP